MKTDELRRELHEAAMELDPFAADPGPVRNRVRNRRVAVAAVVSGVLAIALALPIALVASRDEGEHVAVGSAKSVAVGDLAPRDALITIPIIPTVPNPEKAGAIRRALQRKFEAMASVAHYAALPRGLPTMLLAPTVGTTQLGCSDTGGYLVELRSGASSIAGLRAALGAEATVTPWASVVGADRGTGTRSQFVESILRQAEKPAEIEVFMTVDATPEQIALVRQRIEHDTDVATFTYLDKQAAFAEFRRIFKDQPALIAATTADALPESFRIVPKDRVDLTMLSQHYDGLAGVDEVLSPADVNPCR